MSPGLRQIAEPFVVAPPAGARVRTRLRLSVTDEDVLAALGRRSARCVGTFAGLYEATLDRIEAGGYDVFGPKTRLSAPRKLAVVARGLWR